MALPRRLILSADGNSFETLSTLEINIAGKYYLHELLYNIDYIQAVMPDCYVPDEIYSRLGQKGSLLSRISTVVEFVCHIGETELSELTARVINRRAISRSDYEMVYGDTLLAVKILRVLRVTLRRIASATVSSSELGTNRLVQYISDKEEEFTTRYSELTTRGDWE